MVNVDIEITPTLAFTEDLARYAVSGKPDELRKFWFGAMKELDDLEERLGYYIDVLGQFFRNQIWKKDILESLGLQILNFALHNASEGYQSNEYLTKQDGSKDTKYKQRHEIVKRLYTLKGYGDPSGLTTGQDKLIDSLRPGAADNIFKVKPTAGEVIVGTSFDFARVLEEGGHRALWHWEFTHLGVTIDRKTGNIRPAKWLVDALGDYEDAVDLIMELLQLIYDTGGYIPARPFLKPALWSLRYDRESIGELLEALQTGIQQTTDIATMKTKKNDVINVTVESVDLGGLM